MKYNLYFHCSENTAFDIFMAVKYSFFKICIIFNQYFSVFHYFVYNKIKNTTGTSVFFFLINSSVMHSVHVLNKFPFCTRIFKKS